MRNERPVIMGLVNAHVPPMSPCWRRFECRRRARPSTGIFRPVFMLSVARVLGMVFIFMLER